MDWIRERSSESTEAVARRRGRGKGSKGVIVNVNRSPVTQINIRVYPVDNRSAELARGWHADNYERGRKSLVAGGR